MKTLTIHLPDTVELDDNEARMLGDSVSLYWAVTANRALSSRRDTVTQIVVTALCPFSVAVTTEKKPHQILEAV